MDNQRGGYGEVDVGLCAAAGAYWPTRQMVAVLGLAVLVLALAAIDMQTSSAYDIRNRWTATKTDGVGIERGDAISITWSLVPDNEAYARSGNSDLIVYLDDAWDVPAIDRGDDLTNRPWWDWMDQAYAQFQRVSGITMTYVPERNGDGSDTGFSGDVRIGGSEIDGSTGGILADASFPNGGDIRIDTYRNNGEPSWWHSNQAPGPFRNLVSHEMGHAMGLDHETLTGAETVMKTPISASASFWGLQFDDVYALNYNYGDPLEKQGGNDSPGTAFYVGDLGTSGTAVLGTSATDSVVDQFDSDWVGIDGLSDEDWFRFTVGAGAWSQIQVLPLGPTYSSSQGANTDFSARSNLDLRLFEAGTLTQLLHLDAAGAGMAEWVDAMVLGPGDYYLRVAGDTDQNQFYQVALAASSAFYEPPTSKRLVFTDAFTVLRGASTDVNANRFSTTRQLTSVADSLLQPIVTEAVFDTVDIVDHQLHLSTVHNGDASVHVAGVDLLRNFLPQLEGTRWQMSFQVLLWGDSGVDDQTVFSLLLDDAQPASDPWSLDTSFALTLDAGGVLASLGDGVNLASRVVSPIDLEVSLVVDERGDDTLVDVLLGGELWIEDASIDLAEDGRYFGFRLLNSAANPSGVRLEALIDNVRIELLGMLPQGPDFNGDGLVDDADRQIWEQSLAANEMGDTDGDLDTDGTDFLRWQSGFFTGATPVGTAVPEPATAFLAAVVALAQCRRAGNRAVRSTFAFAGQPYPG
jgi:hypothetical protein